MNTMSKFHASTVLRALFIIGLLILCAPWSPWMPSAGLDPSWVFLLHHAYAEGWQWGKDIVFTFGPYGFTYAGMYHPETYPIMLLAHFLLLGTIGYALFVHARRIPASYLLLALPGICIAISFNHDLMLFAPAIILVFLTTGESRRFPVLGIALSVACAYVALVKFTAVLLAVPLLIISDMCFYILNKRIPFYSVTFLLSTVIFYWLAGQEIANFISYITGSFQVASGYSSAMQSFGPFYEIALFLLVGGLSISWYGWTLWEGDRIIAALRLLAIAIFGFMVFKAGFTRHDGHAMLAFAAMSLGVFMLAGWYFSAMPADRRLNIPSILGAICFCYTYLGLASHFPATNTGNQVMQIAGMTTSKFMGNLHSLLRAGSAEYYDMLETQYAGALAAIRTAHPLPAIQGTVDIYPYEQAAVLAHGLDLRPRPVFQSYSAYSGLLIDLNSRFLEGKSAPLSILFQTGTVDGRFPNLDDGGAWPKLAKWYSVETVSNGFAVLKRLDNPRSVDLVGISKGQVMFGEAIPVPEHQGNLWLALKFRNSLAGSLAKALFKTPTVSLVLNYANGESSLQRIVPDMTNRGFLLNPVIRSGNDFALLLSGSAEDIPVIRNMEVKVNRWFKWMLADGIEFEFSDLRIGRVEEERNRIATDPVLSQLGPLNKLAAGAESLGSPLPSIETYEGMLQLYAHAPTRMKLSSPVARQLLAKFGIRNKAWQEGITDGVCFRISGQDEAETTAVLWERCLTPMTVDADRGEQTAIINLPTLSKKALVFETDNHGGPAWDWSYWSAVQFINP